MSCYLKKNVYFCKTLFLGGNSPGKCVSMCKFLTILGILLFIYFNSWGQENVTIIWKNDTAWYVNPSYDEVYHPTYTPTFTFPAFTESGYLSYRIDWGDGSSFSGPFSTGTDQNITYPYVNSGVFDFRLLLYTSADASGVPGAVYHKKIMNRSLEADFRLSPDRSRRCMEWGGDSVKLILTSHNNPPGTKYEIIVNSDIEKIETAGKKLFTTTWIDGKSDSAWIVALRPTGIYGARVGLNITWEKDSLTLNTPPGKLDMFYAYKSPDLRDIYHFSDTLATGEVLENFQLCIPDDKPSLWLDSAVLAQYQYRTASSPSLSPSYTSINKKLFFDVQYFWTDSTPTPATKWVRVTDKPAYVDTTDAVQFRTAGFYKMRIEAYNQCSYDIKDGTTLLYLDSLWTDSVKDSPSKRYFQAFEQGKDKIECKIDSICLNRSGKVTIVDRNVRQSYDAPPSYEFAVVKIATGEQVPDSDYFRQVKVYKDGGVNTGKAGCDSTEILLTLLDTGDYVVHMTRKCEACPAITAEFNAYVGNLPSPFKTTVIEDKLFADYAFEYNSAEDMYQKCDSFRYALQQEIWSDNNFQTDSVYYFFRKGNTKRDTILNYAQLFYDFDSVGNAPNLIQAKAHNYCGWSGEVSAEFINRVRPDVTLFRDSLPKNDSLCLDFDYRYYFDGTLPGNCSVNFWFDRRAYVDGSLLNDGSRKEIADFKNDGILVRYPELGKIKENFTLINKDMKRCTQEYKDSVYIIVVPDSLVFRDSVRYCAGLTVLETEQLFRPDRKSFKWGEWKWNNTASSDKFPEFNFSVAVDTLDYRLSNSRGCYIGGRLLFRPQQAAQLKLAGTYSACLPDTITDFKGAGYVQTPIDPSMTLYVYKASLLPENLICNAADCNPYPLTSLTDDELRLIYVLKGQDVDTAFSAGCVATDTVDITLFRPELNITKNDTLHHPWNVYDFSSMRNYIDTNDIAGSSLSWRELQSTGGSLVQSGADGLYDFQYTTSGTDRRSDELRFELSAQTVCGKTLKDTLVVTVAHGKLKGYKDQVCSDADYPLWTKVKSSFVDEATLAWKICYPADPLKQGTITGAGNTVAYRPYTGAGRSDSIRIYVEGSFVDATDLLVGDTIILKISEAPVFTVLSDTLIAENYTVNLLKVSNEWFKTENSVSYRIASVVSANNGNLQNDSIYLFAGNPLYSSVNRFARVIVEVEGYVGCPSVSHEFTLLDFCSPDFSFSRPLELCAGDEVELDTVYTRVKGFDKYTDMQWTLEGDSPQGVFDSDSSHYTAPATTGNRKIILKAGKSYKAYNGNLHTGVFTTSRETQVVVHPEPMLTLKHLRDTLCREQNTISVSRAWLNVSPEIYRDSLLLNGRPFRSDKDYVTKAAEGERDSVVFSVNQGRCVKWQDKVQDTLYLYRMRNMVTGDFSTDPMCETESKPLDITGPLYAPEAVGSYWTAEGGTLTGDIPPRFVPDRSKEGNGSVTFFVTPPHGCKADSLKKDVIIYRMPRIQLQPDTVCRVIGQSVTIPVNIVAVGSNMVGVQKVDWYYEGNSGYFESTSGTSPLHYLVNRQDSVAGAVKLVAKIWGQTPCNSLFVYDTVQIVLQDRADIRIKPGNAGMCQGTALDLSGLMDIAHASYVVWSKVPATPGNLTGAVYDPGEYWGNAEFVVKAQGKMGCPAVSENISLPVAYAPLPLPGLLNSVQCQKDTIYAGVTRQPGITAIYQWDFGDYSAVVQGENVKHIYADAGMFRVTVTGNYGLCSRQAELPVQVNEKPKAIFTPLSQVSIGTPVDFASESVPAEVNCKWYFDNGTKTGSSCTHIFTGEPGDRNIVLEVTTLQGCMDSVSHTVKAVKKPVADFKLKIDSCRGTVDIENRSERNFADFAWDFGNGTPYSTDWNPGQQIYSRIFTDTIYEIRLMMKNAAGGDTLTLPVKMVSRLKAKVEVLPASGQCNKMEKEIHIQSSGEADTVKVWWGDGHYEQWGGDLGVVLRKHRYTNEAAEVKYYPLVLAMENVCEADTASPVAVAVYPQSVKARVILDDSYRDECYGSERGFLNKSFGFSQEGYRCEWQFEKKGDIVSDNNPAVAHLFKAPGEYNVKLRVYDNCNEDADSVTVRVHGNDSLDFVVDGDLFCSGNAVEMKFVQKGKAVFGDFRWEFPDGTAAVGSEAEFTFEPGVQTVKLTAIADGCKSGPVSKTVRVNRSPEPLVTKPVNRSGCQPFEVEFEGKNVNDEKVNILWDFKDDAFSNKANAIKEFAEAGTYPVVFRLTTEQGCTDSVVLPVVVLPTPKADMLASQYLFCTETGNFEVGCINTSPDKGSSAFEWWKGGEMISMNNDSVRIPFRGVFGETVVKLKAVHRLSGCAWERADTIVSAHSIKLDLQVEPSEVCHGMPVKFTNHSAYGDYVELDFGDGSRGEEGSIGHTYENSGDFVAVLRVSNKAGCHGTLEKKVTVHPVPDANYSWMSDYTITGLPEDIEVVKKANGGMKFTNLSRIFPNDGDTLRYKWNFGDGTAVLYEKSPRHVFPNNGNYPVTLYASSARGCTDSVTDIVSVSVIKGLYMPNAFAPGVADEGVNRFQPKGIGLHEYKIRIYDEWGTCVWVSDKLADGQPAEWWDGTFKGQPLPGGLYQWKVSAQFKDGTVWSENDGLGSVLLIR